MPADELSKAQRRRTRAYHGLTDAAIQAQARREGKTRLVKYGELSDEYHRRLITKRVERRKLLRAERNEARRTVLRVRKDLRLLKASNRFNAGRFTEKANGPGMTTISIVFRANTDCRNDGRTFTIKDWAFTFDRVVRKSRITPEYVNKLITEFIYECEHEYLRDKGIEVTDVHEPTNVRWYEHKVSRSPINLRHVRVRSPSALRIDNDGDDGSWDTGRGLCALDWMVHVLLTLNKAGELRCKKVIKRGEADIRKLLEGFHPVTGQPISSPVHPLEVRADEPPPTWGPLEEGVCAEQILAACQVLKARLYLIDEDNQCFAYYKGDAGRGSLVLRIQNNHAYPVLNPTIVNSISNSVAVREDAGESSSDEEEAGAAAGGDVNDPVPDGIFGGRRRRRRVAKRYKRGKPVSVDNDMMEGDTIVEEKRPKDELKIVAHENQNDAMAILVQEIERTQTLPAARAIEYYKGAVQSFRLGNTLHTINQDTEATSKLYKALGEPYRGQGLSSVLPLVIKKVGLQLPISHMNPDVFRTLTAKGVKGRMHKGPPRELHHLWQANQAKLQKPKWQKQNQVVVRDLAKAYSACMYSPSMRWMQLNYRDEWQAYDPKVDDCTTVLGIYEVVTTDFTLLKGNNLYTTAILKYAKEQGIRYKVKAKLVASTSHPPELLQPVLDEIVNLTGAYQRGPNGVAGEKLMKRLNVRLSGMLGPSSRTYNSVRVNSSLEMVDAWFQRHGLANSPGIFVRLAHIHHNASGIPDEGFPEEAGEGTPYYLYGFSSKLAQTDSCLPMYLQMLDEANIRLHRMVKALGGTLVYRNIDMAIAACACPPLEGPPADLALTKYGWGSYRDAKVPERLYFEVPSPGVRRKRQEVWLDWGFNSSNQWRSILKAFVSGKGLLLLGRAGTGKTYTLQKIVENLPEGSYARLAPTNKAALLINGQTIHSFLRFDKQGQLDPQQLLHIKRSGLKYVLVDEISMNSMFIWRCLDQLERLVGCTFLLSGDYRQCGPVEPGDAIGTVRNYFDHPVVRKLAGYQRVELTQPQRFDKDSQDLWNASEDIPNCRERFAAQFGSSLQRVNLCWDNRTRKGINHKWMQQEAEAARQAGLPVLELKADLFTEDGQDMLVYPGLPVIANMTAYPIVEHTPTHGKNRGKAVARVDKSLPSVAVNNERFTVAEVQLEPKQVVVVTTRPGRRGGEPVEHKVKLPVARFQEIFLPAYATTVHSSQGDTISEPYTIWQWDIMDETLQYTALTRARRLEQVHFASNNEALNTRSQLPPSLGDQAKGRVLQHKSQDRRAGHDVDVPEYIDPKFVLQQLKAEVAKNLVCRGGHCGGVTMTLESRHTDLKRWSIDRIDNSKPHIKSIVCKHCNNCHTRS